jgi:capsular polysaccharide biosynthesis protein
MSIRSIVCELLSSLLFFCLLYHPLYGNLQKPIGFTTIQQCIEKQIPIQFLLHENHAKQFVLSLHDGVVIGEGGIITKEGEILEDTETYKHDQHKLLSGQRDITTDPSLFFDGKLAVVSSPGQENWYHWLLQVLPRLKILIDSGISYDKIYINNLKYKWQRESLSIVMEKLGIPQDRLLLIEGDHAIIAKTLIVPSVPFIPSKERRFLPSWLKEFIRSTFLIHKECLGAKRIYISRSKASIRRITNETELVQFLKGKGFVVLHLEDLSIYEQAQYFYNAEIIIGPHGSGFTNLIFTQPNTSIIEIDHALETGQRSFFKNMAKNPAYNYMDCNYNAFYVDIVDETDLEKDMCVDIPSFEQFCKNLNLFTL